MTSNQHEDTEPPAETAAAAAAPYGTWSSPISAAAASTAGAKRTDVLVYQGEVYWSERRPTEGGRTVLVKSTPTGAMDVIGSDRNARSRSHEYGGGCTLVCEHGLFFTDDTTRSLIWNPTSPADLGPETHLAETVLHTDAGSALADLRWDAAHERLLAIRERHVDGHHPVAELVALAVGTGGDENSGPEVLVTAEEIDCDFLSNPELSPDGQHLVWIGWSHPHMPWDETTLWQAAVGDDGRLGQPKAIGGGNGTSVFQPRWSPDGILHYVDDSTGWWNIWRLDGDRTTNLTPIEAEFGLPQWVFGMSTYAIPRADRLVAICSGAGLWRMLWLDPRSENPDPENPPTHQPLLGQAERPTVPAQEKGVPGQEKTDHQDSQWTWFDSVAADAETVAVLAAGPLSVPTILSWETASLRQGSPTKPRPLTAPPSLDLPSDLISAGRPISFESPLASVDTASIPSEPRIAHAFFYPPRNPEFRGPGQPPLVVKSHGGPTAATSNALDLQVQYWTSRGFAVVDVNYAGSTGYGRAYRDALRGAWGVRDVEDCASAALALAQRGDVSADHLFIRGGSAGGYTTLAALAFTNVFQAGASLYGIGDLEALARDTHKFEAHYLDSVVGPYPDAKDLYHQRSPLHHADRLSCPVIFFQGSEDKVVPPNQSEAMVEALRAKGVRAEYVLFEGEGHGFRRAENIVDVLERELDFYLEVLELR